MTDDSTRTCRGDTLVVPDEPAAPAEVATTIERLFKTFLGDDLGGLRLEVYDGTDLGPPDAATTVRILSPDFFHRVIIGRGRELAFARAYVAGDIEIRGDIYGALKVRERIEELSIDSALLGDAARVLGLQGIRDLDRKSVV